VLLRLHLIRRKVSEGEPHNASIDNQIFNGLRRCWCNSFKIRTTLGSIGCSRIRRCSSDNGIGGKLSSGCFESPTSCTVREVKAWTVPAADDCLHRITIPKPYQHRISMPGIGTNTDCSRMGVDRNGVMLITTAPVGLVGLISLVSVVPATGYATCVKSWTFVR